MTFTRLGNSVTVKGVQLPFARSESPMQNMMTAINGKVFVYNRNWREDLIQIKVIDSIANIETLRAWMQANIVGSLNSFTLTPDTGVNAGNGNGQPVTVRIWGDAMLPIDYLSPNESSLNILLRKEVP